MKNVEMTKEGNFLIIKIDLNKQYGKSASGKSITVATTGGNVAVPGAEHVKLGINCYTAVQ